MFSTKERREADRQGSSRRNRNTDAGMRRTHDSIVGTTPSSHNEGLGALIVSSDEQKPWDEMVFEHRNRAYGAYVLRKGYSGNVVVGLGITILVVLFLIFYPSLAKLFADAGPPKAPPRKLVYSELSLPPPIDKPKPVPPQILLPRLQKVVKFVPPKVVREAVENITPTLDEIKDSNTGAAEVAGPAVEFDEPVEEVVVEEDNEIFIVVDQQPEFEGGYEAMMAFIKQNMKYPPNARRMQIEGTVHVSFVVSKAGTISEVKVMRGIMTECDKEAVRVIEMMPPWKPGKQNGRAVNVRFILPLKFRLN